MADVRTVENVADFDKLLGDAGRYKNNFTGYFFLWFFFFAFPRALVTVGLLTLIKKLNKV